MPHKLLNQLDEIESTFALYSYPKLDELNKAFHDLKTFIIKLKNSKNILQLDLILEKLLAIAAKVCDEEVKALKISPAEIAQTIFFPLYEIVDQTSFNKHKFSLLLKLGDLELAGTEKFLEGSFPERSALIYYVKGLRLAKKQDHKDAVAIFTQRIVELEKIVASYVIKASISPKHEAHLQNFIINSVAELETSFLQANHYIDPLIQLNYFHIAREMYEKIFNAYSNFGSIRRSEELKTKLTELYLAKIGTINEIEHTAKKESFYLTSANELDKIRKSIPSLLRTDKQAEAKDRLPINKTSIEAIKISQKQLILNFTNYFSTLIKYCIQHTGTPPIAFDVLWLGSPTQGNFTPYSDAEFAIVLTRFAKSIKEQPNQEERKFFNTLLNFINFEINIHGEWEGNITTHLGFCVDPLANPAADDRLMRPPEALATAFNFNETGDKNIYLEDGLGYALFQPMPIYSSDGSLTLFQSYQVFNKKNQINTLYDPKLVIRNDYCAYITKALALHKARALACLERDIQYCEKSSPSNSKDDNKNFLPNINEILGTRYEALNGIYQQLSHQFCMKKRFVKPLSYFILDIRLYYGLNVETVSDSINVLSENNRFHKKFAKELDEAIAILTIIRFRQQYYYQQQRQPELVIAPNVSNSEDLYQLNAEEYAAILDIEKRIIFPFYVVLRNWLQNRTIIEKLDNLQKLDVAEEAISIMINEYSNTDNAEKKQHILEETQLLASALIATLQHRKAALNDYFRYYQTIANFPLLNAFQNFTIELLTLLERQQASDQIYLSYYRQLPDQYRPFFLTTLEASRKAQKSPHDKTSLQLQEKLEKIPYRNGLRPYILKQRAAWELSLLNMTEPYDPDLREAYSQNNQVTVSWHTDKGFIRRILKKTIADQLFEKNGELKPRPKKPGSDENLLPGRRWCQPIKDVDGHIIAFAKFPEMPGVHLSSERLIHRISGLASFSTLAKFEHPALKGEMAYPLLLSNPAGTTLLDIRKKQDNLSKVENNLDPSAFTFKVIETLMLQKGDDKDDNIAIDETKKVFELISFDHDQDFTETATTNHLLNVTVNVRSLSYFFAEMKAPLDPDAVADFNYLDIDLTLNDWLEELNNLSTLIGDGKNNKTLFNSVEIDFYQQKDDKSPEFCFIPLAFVPGTGCKLFRHGKCIQAAFQDMSAQLADHFALVRSIEPYLALHCEQAFEQGYSPETRFEWFAKQHTDYKSETVVSPITDNNAADNLKACNLVYYQSTYSQPKLRAYKSVLNNKISLKNFKDALRAGELCDAQYLLHKELKQQMSKIFNTIQKIRNQLQQGDLSLFDELLKPTKDPTIDNYTDFIREKVINGLKWDELPEQEISRENLQRYFLYRMTKIRFSTLVIQNCDALDDDTLNSIIKKSPNLTHVYLTNCKNISEKGLTEIIYHPVLEVL